MVHGAWQAEAAVQLAKLPILCKQLQSDNDIIVNLFWHSVFNMVLAFQANLLSAAFYLWKIAAPQNFGSRSVLIDTIPSWMPGTTGEIT